MKLNFKSNKKIQIVYLIYAADGKHDGYVGKTIQPWKRYYKNKIKAAKRIKQNGGYQDHSHRARWLRKIKFKVKFRILEIVPLGKSLEKAERYWIKCYRKVFKWRLKNETDGGEGTAGFKWSSQSRAKITGINSPMYGKHPVSPNKGKHPWNYKKHTGYAAWNKGKHTGIIPWNKGKHNGYAPPWKGKHLSKAHLNNVRKWHREHPKARAGKNNSMYGKGYLLRGKRNGMFGKPSAMKGRHHTKEVVEDLRKRMTGKNNPMYGKGYLRTGRKNPMFNKHLSRHSRDKISASLRKLYANKKKIQQ